MPSSLRTTAFSGQAVAARSPRRAPQAMNAVARTVANRPLWLPGGTPPAHLDGSLPGDYGFDPLGLGANPESLRWYQQAELFHGRLAMMATAGIILPGVFTKVGALNVPEWFEAGKVAQESSPIPFSTLLMMEFILMGWVETKRWMDIRNPGSQGEGSGFPFAEFFKGSGEPGYPGGIFDPLNLAGDESLKVKEIKNGRLAMFSFMGYVAQYSATGKGPVDNWFDHIQDPWNVNFATNGVSLPGGV